MSLMAYTGGFLGGKSMYYASATSPLHLQDDTGKINIEITTHKDGIQFTLR